MSSFPELIAGRYERKVLLGGGGMGKVYRCWDRVLQRPVAIKMIRPELADHAEAQARFRWEAIAHAAPNHRNIADVYDLLEEEGQRYLVIEYVVGDTLAAVIVDDGAMPLRRALHVGLQLARALEAGHAVGIVHRDIKPGNVMITAGDGVRLMDFGLAAMLSRRDDASSWDGANRHLSHDAPTLAPEAVPSEPLPPGSGPVVGPGATRPGQQMGTPGYMAPEQAEGKTIGFGTDLWAFACVLYECLTGSPAFVGESGRERIEATLHQEPDLDALDGVAPAAVVDLLRHCFVKDPGRRKSKISEVCEILEELDAAHDASPRRAGRRHNLPVPPTSYIPRPKEIQHVRTLVERDRLVTLAGFGGVGKTRLAVQIGHELSRAHTHTGHDWMADGLWFVGLAPVKDPAAVIPTVTEILVREGVIAAPPTESDATSLASLLRDQRLVLILDNCEHVREPCGELMTAVGTGCPEVRVIATSRETLDGSVQTHRVGGLPVAGAASERSAAVQLFEQRAAGARGQNPQMFKLDAESAHAAAEICSRLGGIPLAIELAAALVSSMSVSDIATRLFDVLDPAHKLESSIAWSVDLLDDAGRVLLGRLSIFRGGWTLAAAEQVCGDTGKTTVRRHAVATVLSQLVEKSLVQRAHDGSERYEMLEAIRTYARQRLLKGKARTTTGHRHLAFFRDLAITADAASDGSERAAWLNRLEQEVDNIRAAIQAGQADEDAEHHARFVHAMYSFWIVRGHLPEAMDVMEKALARRPDADDVPQIRLLNAAGNVAGSMGDASRASAWCQQALALARKAGDQRREAGILTNLGLWSEKIGDMVSGRLWHEESIALYRAIGDDLGEAYSQLNLGSLARHEGRLDEAVTTLEACLPVFSRAGDDRRLAVTHRNLGEVAFEREQIGDAVRHFREALRVMETLRDQRESTVLLMWQALCAERGGEPDVATVLLAASQRLADVLNVPLPVHLVNEVEAAVARLRADRSSLTFEEQWAYGRGLAIEEAIAYAHGEGPAPPHSSDTTAFF